MKRKFDKINADDFKTTDANAAEQASITTTTILQQHSWAPPWRGVLASADNDLVTSAAALAVETARGIALQKRRAGTEAMRTLEEPPWRGALAAAAEGRVTSN